MPGRSSREAAPLEYEDVVLTVSEGKRLIGLGVAALPAVQRALQSGVIGIARGSTNGYVAEAILGRDLDRTAFTTGLTLPPGQMPGAFRHGRMMGELVVEQGVVIAGKTTAEAARTMKPDDVLIKGANALNYRRKVAGILIESAEGGTIAGLIGHVMGKHLHLVIPIGLEKEISADIGEVSRALAERHHQPALGLWPVMGTIVTEIEALATLSGAEVMQLAAGGVGGAEGSIRLLLWGTTEQIERARAVVQRVRGELPFAEAAAAHFERYGQR